MTRAQIAVRLAQGKWVKAWDAATLFHVYPHELIKIFDYRYDMSWRINYNDVQDYDHMEFRIKPIPEHCNACEYDYLDCISAEQCFQEVKNGTGKERKD